MDIINRFILLNKLKEKLTISIDDNTLSVILQQLDKLNALNDNWTENNNSTINTNTDNINNSTEKSEKLSKNKLPQSFHLKTPLFQGQVHLSIDEGMFCYRDDYDNIRLYDKTEKGLLKKVQKYS
jgi:hypothetical protein